MVFLSGPRQAGKTTLSKILAPHSQNYFNWDFVQFRKRWIKGSEQIAEEVLNEKNPIIILDEFHKNKKWKNQLKGFFDQYGTLIKIIVTGSARLNLFRKGADSLMGRFIHFHLLPYSFGEIENAEPMSFSDWIYFMQQPKVNKLSEKSFLNIDRLFKFGGFPEAFENENEEFQKRFNRYVITLHCQHFDE